ncbi:MAG: hypothetical protein JSU88_09320 [Nitrospinaceae bacterium]|nr:MAG: hypothetical protein JSU88_09320 [Nitrospinaceae bacterium]
MKPTDWLTQDYNAAFDFLLDHEEAARACPIVDTGQGVVAVLPTALPGLGVRFIGLFMLAPIAVFLVTVAAFPFLVLGPPWEWTANGLFVAGLSVALFLGLLFALKLMLGNRDLFPRIFFVTLGATGIGMHFSRWHRLFKNPVVGIPWNRVGAVSTRETLYAPALVLGIVRTTLLEVTSPDGASIVIPLAPGAQPDLAEDLRRRIGERARR